MRIAIAGNIASGKTAVEGFFREFGYEVLDTDKIAHSILNSDVAVEIINAFTGEDISDNGVINRKKLGDIVFSNYHSRKKLENIVHPIIREELQKYFDLKKDSDVVLVAIPLVFEAKMEDLFDKIIFVFADDETRLERLMLRNDYTEQEALKRINSQMSQFMKLEDSDYVFHNNGTLDNLKNQVKDFCMKILGGIND